MASYGDDKITRSATNSDTKAAIDFLRVDKARFNGGRTPVPIPRAFVEQQRKRLMNKRFQTCMLMRSKTKKENDRKLEEKNDDWIEEMRSTSDLSKNSVTKLLPWPGFRYRNNGEKRKLSHAEIQRRLLSCANAGQRYKETAADDAWTSEKDSSIDGDTTQKSSRLAVGRSLDTLQALIDRRKALIRSNSQPLGPQSRSFDSNDLDAYLSLDNFITPSWTNRDFLNGIPSKQTALSFRNSLNQFQPVVTSSIWCKGVDELIQREDLIPKDSFRIKFGLSSQMLNKRRSTLDEYRRKQTVRNQETVKKVNKYIAHIKKHHQRSINRQ